MKKFTLVGLIFLGTLVCAQEAPAAPKPGPEHAKMAFFLGSWNAEGEMKSGPLGPGGKFTYVANCDWMSGNFAILCPLRSADAWRTITGTSILSCAPAEKSPIYFDTNSMGQNTFSHSLAEGDSGFGIGQVRTPQNGKTVHSRYTVKRLTDDSACFKYEMATEEPLAVIMRGKQTRQK